MVSVPSVAFVCHPRFLTQQDAVYALYDSNPFVIDNVRYTHNYMFLVIDSGVIRLRLSGFGTFEYQQGASIPNLHIVSI